MLSDLIVLLLERAATLSDSYLLLRRPSSPRVTRAKLHAPRKSANPLPKEIELSQLLLLPLLYLLPLDVVTDLNSEIRGRHLAAALCIRLARWKWKIRQRWGALFCRGGLRPLFTQSVWRRWLLWSLARICEIVDDENTCGTRGKREWMDRNRWRRREDRCRRRRESQVRGVCHVSRLFYMAMGHVYTF